MAVRARVRPRASARKLVDELKMVAERVGYTVREEKLLREVGYHVRGGGCVVKGTKMIFLDRDASAEWQLEVLVEVLSEEQLENVFLSPAARQLFRRQLGSGADAGEAA